MKWQWNQLKATDPCDVVRTLYLCPKFTIVWKLAEQLYFIGQI